MTNIRTIIENQVSHKSKINTLKCQFLDEKIHEKQVLHHYITQCKSDIFYLKRHTKTKNLENRRFIDDIKEMKKQSKKIKNKLDNNKVVDM